ncbi:MAG: hypothetical protein Q4G07_08795 [Oscillospiraceae bacterium]|nr:hypothetical protein [Oscillospiraceae bacterium]
MKRIYKLPNIPAEAQLYMYKQKEETLEVLRQTAERLGPKEAAALKAAAKKLKKL